MIRKILYAAATALTLVPILCLAQSPLGFTVTKFAGTGTAGFAGDGGPATDAQFKGPAAVAFDSSGSLYIADQLNFRIRKISGGTVSTYAGKGDRGYFGDTGQATAAGLSLPKAIGFDSQGNLYIADTPNQGIRKVTSAGVITTIVAGSFAAFDGDGGNAKDAHINTPSGIAVTPGGEFYFSDTFNNRIRKVTSDGKIDTIAGNGTQGLSGDGGPAKSATLTVPQGLALDSKGNLYIADTGNHAIRKIDAATQNITTVAGTGQAGFSGDGGQATQAQLYNPRGVAVDANGVVYIADTFNSRIRAVSLNGTISTIAGNGYFGDAGDDGPSNIAIFRFPEGITIDSAGALYIADTQNNRIRKLTPVPVPGPPPGPPVISGGVTSPAGFGGGAAISPGSWIEIYGDRLASSTRQWTAAEFTGTTAPVTLDGTRVTIGGRNTFVSYISPTQVNAQVPSDIGTGPQQITVITGAGSSAPFNITVNPTQPGLLAPPAFRVGERQYAVALLPIQGSYALPVAAVPGLAGRPAKPGETIVLFGVGFGPVTPNILAGQVVQVLNTINTQLQIRFGQTPAQISYAGLSPGSIGLYQFNVTVPDIPDSDVVPITYTLGGTTSPQTLFTAVRR